jgi:hypothetical protein
MSATDNPAARQKLVCQCGQHYIRYQHMSSHSWENIILFLSVSYRLGRVTGDYPCAMQEIAGIYLPCATDTSEYSKNLRHWHPP